MKRCSTILTVLFVFPVFAGDAEWHIWPDKGRFQVEMQSDEQGKIVSFNSVESAGYARTPLAVPAGKRLKAICFQARTMPNATRHNQEVMLEEKSGEMFFSNLKLSDEWNDFTVSVDALSLYPYGGAVVENGRLDQKQIVSLRFNCFPKGGRCQIRNLTLEWEDDPDAVPVFTQRIPLPGDPAAWFCWSGAGSGKLACRAAANDPEALEIDARSAGGHASLRLAPPRGRVLDAFSFEIRRLPDSTADHVEVMLLEASGEIFYKYLPLPAEYERLRLTASDLKHYSYGGAPKINGTLEMEEVTFFRFNCYPKGQDFLIRNLQFEYSGRTGDVAEEDAAATPPPDGHNAFLIREIELPETREVHRDDYPALPRIGIQGDLFTSDDVPFFMLGGWQLDQEGPPWIMRTLDVDVMVYNADEIYTLYGGKRLDDGRIEVEWLANPWYPTVIERLVSNGVNFWHEHKGHPEYNTLRKFPEGKGILNAGHFVPYDPFDPTGEKFYLEMFKSWMRYTADYPIFAYELFNEMIYNNPLPRSRAAFRAAMQRKYGNDIAAANRAWGTHFADFAAVRIPGYLTDDGANDALPRALLTQREGMQYRNLYIDWQKFQEERCYEAVRNLMPKMRALDPSPEPFRTLQSHMQFLTDYANVGIKPETLVDFSDFYSHECGCSLVDAGNRRSDEALFTMLRTMLAADLVKSICPAKPVFDAEAPVFLRTVGASEAQLVATDLAGLTGEWKFFDATGTEPEDWQSAAFDDSSWGTVKVPAMWGKEGYPECQTGLYRKRFPRPEGDGAIYLNGQGFADEAELWLNGRKIGSVEGYDRKFTFDVTADLADENLLAVRIRNTYFSDGMYFGGIRGFASVNDDVLVPRESGVLTDRHLRGALWNMAIHGVAGLMFCYEANLFTPAAKALPRIKAEISTVISLLHDPAARPPSPLAVVYPQETFRGLIHSDYLEKMKAPATLELLSWYAPLQFSRLGLRVIRNKDIEEGKLEGVRFIALPENCRISARGFDNLKKFVAAGGMILADLNALTIDDETHAPLDNSDFLGFTKVAESALPATVADSRFGSFSVTARFLDKLSRVEIAPRPDAGILATFADGKPLLIEHPFGRGRVWSLTGALPPEAVRKVIAFLMEKVGLSAPVELSGIDGNAAPYAVDARLFNAGKDRQLLYLLNWETGCTARVSIPSMPDGEYHVRNLARPDGEERLWRAEALRDGIELRLEKFDPVTLLIEKAGTPRLPVRGISPTRLAILNELWRATPEVAGQPTVAISGIFGGTTAENTGTIPTAWKVLTDNGFNVRNFLNGRTSLDDVDVLVWQQQRLRMADPQSVLEFVRNGGGLLLCGNAVLTYHNGTGNEKLLQELQLSFGDVRRTVLYDQTPGSRDVLRNVCGNFAEDHPIAAGVRQFVTAGSGFLDAAPPGSEVILAAPASSSAPGKPLIVAFAYGKGRVVWISDHWFLRPFNFEEGDNIQLWFNIINFLAGRPVRLLTPEERAEALFLTRERLEQAEREEAAGEFVFTPLASSPTTLAVKDADDLIGLAGGDPIVDQFK